MEGIMLYHKYMKPNSEYYGISEEKRKDNKYEVKDILEIYTVVSESESIWIHYHINGLKLPDQGWKIHVTTTVEDSMSVLEKVARLCMDKEIEFKHLNNMILRQMLGWSDLVLSNHSTFSIRSIQANAFRRRIDEPPRLKPVDFLQHADGIDMVLSIFQ